MTILLRFLCQALPLVSSEILTHALIFNERSGYLKGESQAKKLSTLKKTSSGLHFFFFVFLIAYIARIKVRFGFAVQKIT